ncbi:MAG TPA: preprotein translocase subunit YajC [Polyangiaceae bacterium]|nr:preprotein translocase subunit YajC [Polyangiaceae bacterium]
MVALLSFQNVPPAPGRETGANTVAPSVPADKGAPGAPPHAAEGGLGGMLPMLIMVVPLILLMVFTSRSNSKKQKKLLESLQKGDRVITQGGMVGKLVEIGDRYAKVELAPGMKVDFLKSGLLGKDDAETAASLEKK